MLSLLRHLPGVDEFNLNHQNYFFFLRQFYLSGVDELDQFFELLERSGFNCLDGDAVFFGFAREFGKETVGRFVTEEDNAALTQALDGSVQTARRRAKVDHNINLSFASIFGAVDQDSLVQLFAPLNDVNPKSINSLLPNVLYQYSNFFEILLVILRNNKQLL